MGSVPVEVNVHMDSSNGASAANSVFPEVSDDSDIFGEPEIHPRLGDEYQVEVPSLITVSEYPRLSNNLAEAEITSGGPHNSLIRMSIPLVWISEDTEIKKHGEQEAFKGVDMGNNIESLESECIDITSNVKVKPIDTTSVNGTEEGESENLVLQKDIMAELQPEHGGKGHLLVPGCLGVFWSDIEEASFLLGLYIFGKNLVVVKKFVGTKQMADILSYYYGRFYGSERYRRWSECRKIKSKRCIFGQRIFTGLRHQELLSRLLDYVSEERQNTLLEISKTFGEGKILLEEYVFILKATFGLNALVEAVGVGKGKQDLTGIVMDTPKSSQVAPVRPEMPIGKECSALNNPEIIKYLTGDFRLSKARSSDLFWEAVWPRLLQTGWHSEQPNNRGFIAGSKHSLVFLIPGIKKFSRRKLVKGDQYFDSVTDVLSKVASNPGLLEIENYISKEEHGWTDDKKLAQEDFPNLRRHSYLKPRTPSRSTDVIDFTVVDTSLRNGKSCKMSEMQIFCLEKMNSSTSLSELEEDDGDSSEESADKSISVHTLHSDKDKTNDLTATTIELCKTLPFGGKDFEYNASKQRVPVNPLGLTTMPAKVFKEKEADVLDSIQLNKDTESKLIQKRVSDNMKPIASVPKRRRKLPPSRKELTSCSTTNSSVDSGFQQESNSCINSSGFSENMLSQEKLSLTSSSRGGSPIIATEGIANGNPVAAEHPHEKPPLPTVIYLNVTTTPNAEIDKTFLIDKTEGQDRQTTKELDSPQAVKSPEIVAKPEQETKVLPRRQSTRIRPLTTRVLEAYACGFLETKQKRKTKDAIPGENSKKRSSVHPRARVTPPEISNATTVDFIVKQNGTDIQNSTNADVFKNLGNGVSSQTS
ncbi:Homeodomain-like [Parasponia andersonii]|uniref:Homeodomain-like n=1 Tax=Parasponia andersonii TaxID=3476 RepID=A0A2P5E471_PARAD|nr:Homeodomain-like [Parasponia andersonii]